MKLAKHIPPAAPFLMHNLYHPTNLSFDATQPLQLIKSRDIREGQNESEINTWFFLFLRGLFNDAVSSSHSIAPNNND